MELFLAELEEKVLAKKDERGLDVHPELKQYYERWLGYIFWKYEDAFNIRNHIQYYNGPDSNQPITTSELSRIEGEMIFKAFPPKMSPWEVLYIRHFQPELDANPSAQKSLIIFR